MFANKKKLLVILGLPAAAAGGLLSVAVVAFVLMNWFGATPNIFGLGDGPTQPIAFPHTVHAGVGDGQAGIDCTFCHRNVEFGAAATVPAVEQCMICHSKIGDGNAEIEKLRAHAANQEPIDWVRVHRLPDSVRFVHEAHITYFTEKDNINAAQVCATCHGDVASMEVVKQDKPLKMGWCIDCHRVNSAPTDCTTCHY